MGWRYFWSIQPSNFHPDTARANSGIFHDQLMISTGMHFGGNFGPSNQEPVAWARCELAKHLFQHKTYHVQLNKHLQDIIQIDTTMQLPTHNRTYSGIKVTGLQTPDSKQLTTFLTKLPSIMTIVGLFVLLETSTKTLDPIQPSLPPSAATSIWGI
jgi:hypothetical protein